MNRIRKIVANLGLTVASTVFGCLLVEGALRIVDPDSQTFSSFFPRYVVNGTPTPHATYFAASTDLPYRLKPHFAARILDRAWTPRPYNATIDRHGYRNADVSSMSYDEVVVGDSVAFGMGVDDSQTFAARLGGVPQAYSLAVPGYGPESYMRALNEFLERATVKRVSVLYFLGNDDTDLANATWDGLSTCAPPSTGRIRRRDVAESSGHPGTLAFSFGVRHSAVLYRLFGLMQRSSDAARSDEPLSAVLARLWAAARDDLNGKLHLRQTREAAIDAATPHIHDLAQSSCVTLEERASLIDFPDRARANPDAIDPQLGAILARLAAAGCYPIGRRWDNALAYANYHAVYTMASADGFRAGFDGNVTNLTKFIDGLADAANQRLTEVARKAVSAIKSSRDHSTIVAAIDLLMAELTAQTTAPGTETTCDKSEIFFRYLEERSKGGSRVELWLIPAERQLQPGIAADRARLVASATKHGLYVIDLYEPLLAHYTTPGAHSLYLDGSHMTAEGIELVVSHVRQRRSTP